MFQHKIPVCVTVIGWSWIIIGIIVGVSNLIALLYYLTNKPIIVTSHDAHLGILNTLIFFKLLAIIQVGLAVFGLISGINFLRLKAWSRKSLEVLTWFLLFSIAGVIIVRVINEFTVASSNSQIRFATRNMFIGIFMLGCYGLPLGIMLKFLRGDTVKTAMIIGAALSL